MSNRQCKHGNEPAQRSSLIAHSSYERSHLFLVTHFRARRIPLWIRHCRHLWRGKNDSGAVGSHALRAWDCDGVGALRHRTGLSAGRVACGPLRAQSYAALDRRSLPSGCGGISIGPQRCGLHRGTRRRWFGNWHLDRCRPYVYRRNCASEATRTVGGNVPIQHRFRHSHCIRFQCTTRGNWRARVAMDVGSGGVSFLALCAVLPRSAGESSLAS